MPWRVGQNAGRWFYCLDIGGFAVDIGDMTGCARNLYIIDGHAHIYAAYYAPMRPLNSPTGEPTKATYIFTTAILGLIDRKKPDMLVVAMDSKGPTFRSEIYTDYKAHRPPMPEDMPVQIDRIEQILEAMNIPILRVDGYEADDIMGTLARSASEKGIDTYICSKDKDMLQLLDEHTFAYDMKKDLIIDVASMKEQMGVTPAQFVDVLALQGDTADNIPGVKDVGPKTALQWIQKYGSLEELFAHADEIGGKRGDNLRNSREMVMMSRRLVTINRRIPIEFDCDTFRLTEPDKARLAEIFAGLGFTRLITQLDLPRVETADAPESAGPAATPKKTGRRNYHLVDTQEKLDRFVAELKKQKIFAIDTETTALDAMRADLVGMSFCWKVHTAYYLPVKAPLGQKHLDMQAVRRKIAPVLADEKIKKIGQNIKYDILVLHNAKMPLKGVSFDTMVASYCLASDRQSHSMDAITLQLYEYLSKQLDAQPRIKKLFDEVEMPLVPVLAQMELNGVSLDVKLLRDMSHAITEDIERLKEDIYTRAGFVFNIDSTKQLSGVLFDRLGLTSLKMGKTTRSTDASVLEQLRGEHEIIPLILEYRQLVKLKNTYVDKLGKLINPRTGRVHASFNQTITATGRLSSSDPNLQNIPVRTELGRRIRSAFVPADKNDCILSADYSQIELRLLAHFSGDEALRQAFAEDRDIHAFVASQVFGVPLSKVTGDMRARSKAVNFGIIYGQGAYGLSQSIGISQAEAKKFIDDYFARYSSIRAFMDGAIARARKDGFAETMLGRRRRITGLSARNFNRRAQAERLVINTIIQGSAADLIKVAMINIQKKIDAEKMPVRMILQIHDELVFELPKKDAAKYAEWIAEEMTTAVKLDVPLKVDIATGPTWLTDK